MRAKPKTTEVQTGLTRAVAYCRKSTKGKRKNGQEKQEKSIDAQRREIIALAKAENYDIVRWYEDAGVSGWKRDAKRPDFARMLADAQQMRDVDAILCDDLDRFSRAEVMEVFSDLTAFAAAGVKVVLCVKQGRYTLGENDIGKIITLLIDCHGSNAYSRNLSRRVTIASRNKAEKGHRNGAVAPYGYQLDGEVVEGQWVPNGLLKKGDRKEVQLVRWIFEQFVHKAQSLSHIVSQLNAREARGPRGGKWTVTTLAKVVRNPVYKGAFRYNERHVGQFHGIGADGEVLETSKLNGERKVYFKENWCEPLVERKLWERAQVRLAQRAIDRTRRKAGYTLSGILVCGHCGAGMYASAGPDGPVVYKCGRNAMEGRRSCGYWRVREDVIAPFVLRMLGEELKNVEEMLTHPPAHLRKPQRNQASRRAMLEKRKAELVDDVANAERNIIKVRDPRQLESLTKMVSSMRDELEAVEQELLIEQQNGSDIHKEQLQAFNREWKRFWSDHREDAVSVPVSGKLPKAAHFHQDPMAEDARLLIDKRIVNEALKDLGAEVRLRWATDRSGKQVRHRIVQGRFRLGQKSGRIPRDVLTTMDGHCTSPADRSYGRKS